MFLLNFQQFCAMQRNIVPGNLGSFKHCQAHTGGRTQLPSPLLSGGGVPPLPPSQTWSACSLPAKCVFANVPRHIIPLPSMYPSLESSPWLTSLTLLHTRVKGNPSQSKLINSLRQDGAAGNLFSPLLPDYCCIGAHHKEYLSPQRQDLLWFSEGQVSTKDNPICAGNLYSLSGGFFSFWWCILHRIHKTRAWENPGMLLINYPWETMQLKQFRLNSRVDNS